VCTTASSRSTSRLLHRAWGATVASHAARQAAYAELVAGLLDVRDEGAQERFDGQVEQLVAEGLMTPDVARSVRLLQRQSVRAVVEHAQAVLPTTLMALESSHREQWLNQFAEDDNPEDLDGLLDASTDVLSDELADLTDEMPDDISDDNVAQDGPVDLTARRLLVAGLTLLPDP